MPKRKVDYEWDLEPFDPVSGDVLDHDHSDTCPGLPREPNVQLVLVRDVCEYEESPDADGDLADRAWAYVVDGKLPEAFSNGERVPKRFHTELAKTTDEGETT